MTDRFPEAIALTSAEVRVLRDAGRVVIYQQQAYPDARPASRPRSKRFEGCRVLEPWVKAGDHVLYGADQRLVPDRSLQPSEDMPLEHSRFTATVVVWHGHRTRERAVAAFDVEPPESWYATPHEHRQVVEVILSTNEK